MARHAHRRSYPRTQQNTTTLPIQTRPTNGNKLHNTTSGQTTTPLTSTDVRVTPQGPDPRPTRGPAATTQGRTRTARVPHQPRAGKKQRGGPLDRLLPPEGRTMTVALATAESATNHNDPDRADLAQHDPSYNPATRGRATCYGTTRRPDTPAGTASTCPARTTDTQGVEASLSSPRCRTQIQPQGPLPTSPGRGPHFPDLSDPPAMRKGAAPHPGPPSDLTLLSHVTGPRGAGQRVQPHMRSPRPNR